MNTKNKKSYRFKRVLLLNPPYKTKFIREARCQHRVSKVHAIFSPITLLYIGTILEKEGIKVRLFDFNVETMRDFEKLLKNNLFDLIISTTSTPTFEDDVKFLDELKEKTKSKIALTSVHTTYFSKQILKKYNFIDYLLIYEPEYPARDLCVNKPLESIKGLAYRDNNKKIRVNNESNPLNLKEIKIPSWHLVKIHRYKVPIINEPYAIIQTGRGCPFNCDFCIVPFYFGNKVRKRNVEDIIKEIEYLINKGIRFFYFFDETFNDDKKFLKELLKKIKKYKISYVCNSRLDLIDEEEAKLFYESGIFFLAVGIESFDDKALEKMNKKVNSKIIEEKIKILNKYKVPIYGHFIVGYDSNPIKDAFKAIKLGLTFANFYTLSPFPGSRIYEKYKYRNINFKKIDFENFDSDSKKMKRIAMLSFYSNPIILMRILRLFIKKIMKI